MTPESQNRRSLLRNDSLKIFPRNDYVSNNRLTSVAMQQYRKHASQQ
jgi:hypothetical protein